MLPALLPLLITATALDRGPPDAVEIWRPALGRTVPLHCLVSGPVLRWEWKPKYPTCAGIGARHVTVMGPAGFTSQLRFRNRLHGGVGSHHLRLQGVLMGDSGTYTCVAASGKKWTTDLQVKEGCFNNINLSVIESGPAASILYCKLCNPERPETSFTWTVNGIPLAQLQEGLRMRTGAIVSVPLSSKSLLGAWRCTSTENPAWYSEHCLEPASPDYDPEESMETGEEREPEAGPASATLSLFQLILVALAALAFLALAILCICSLWRRLRDRQQEPCEDALEGILGEEQEPPSVGCKQQGRAAVSRTPSEADVDGVHYVELEQLPPSRQAPQPPSLVPSPTVYATIV
ncbi:uncharacterized protein LOC115080725 isoform X2 [Rhinatrema bivittatum]|uniref:uncharacterized protein LOC115080725 isoform X2 n=1 Tax=Rhinatrema bivittatum TaxID=194408 RepID=UPI00112BE87A|nr:uncharacterized protein LOC115080725 isoform X2 [Rhinatrema bivittatum]